MSQVIFGSRSKGDPNLTLAVLGIGRNTVQGSIFRLHLITHFCIRPDDLQTCMGTTVLAGELRQKWDPSIGLDLCGIAPIG